MWALAPHRPWFLCGALAWLALAAWWSWVGQASGQHGLLFTLGFLPFFIAGFALTTLPKWLAVKPPPSVASLGPLGLVLLGWCLHASVWPGLWLVAVGWSWLVLHLTLLLRHSPKADRRHPQGVLLGMGLLAAAMWLAALGLHTQATQLGLWGGLGTVFAFALQRLTPFLHGDDWLADGLLVTLLLGLWLRGLAPPGWLPHLAWLVLAVWLTWAAFRPVLAAARRTPFVAQLHRGLLWLAVSFGLAALGLEVASLHALTLGFMCTTALAMVSRVTAVQQKPPRPVVGLPLRVMHALLQGVCALRVATACWPQAPHWWLPAAAGGFALLALAWLLRYGPWLWRPQQKYR